MEIKHLERDSALNAKLDKVLCSSAGLGKQGEFLVEQALTQ